MNEYALGALLISMFGFGVFSGVVTTNSDVMENTISGYHCQPIQKVETLEEAKAIIEQHQAMARG